jgi:hypothetical protein
MFSRTSRSRSAAHRVREAARWAALLSAVLLCDSARTQADSDTVARLVANDAARQLSNADPVVRGEAALVLAARQNPQNHTAILAMAKDADEAAQLRGILALGLQASPGVANVLGDLLAEQAGRCKPPGIAAAFALGSLPPDHAPSVVNQLLTSFLQSSLKRQRDVMLALLQGMRQFDQSLQLTALHRLYEEESNRDPEVRAALLEVLLPIDPAFDAVRLRKILERGSDAERNTLVAWLAKNSSSADAELVTPFERLATQSNRASVRANALAMLTRMRYLPALEIAAKALRSKDPLEVSQGMRSALQIGGSSMRRALERHLCTEPDPELQAAMLRAWSAPPSAELADLCARAASERQKPQTLRTAAVLVLARSDASRAAPLLRDLFRETDHFEMLAELAAAVMQTEGGEAQLARLLHGPTDLRQHPERWRALLSAGHPEAIRQLLESLQDRRLPAADLALALRCWREATTGITPQVLQQLPIELGDSRPRR